MCTIQSKRRGVIRLDEFCTRDWTEEWVGMPMEAFMANVVFKDIYVHHTVPCPQYGYTEYWCYSELFDQVEDGLIVPEYTMVFERVETPMGVTVVRKEVRLAMSIAVQTGQLKLRPRWMDQPVEVLAQQMWAGFDYSSRTAAGGHQIKLPWEKLSEVDHQVWIAMAECVQKCEGEMFCLAE